MKTLLFIMLTGSVSFAASKAPDNPNQFRYVFITGFLNEALVVNFADELRTLNQAGVQADSLHTINLPSHQSAQQNAKALFSELTKLNKSKRKPLVLFAHSKGALETLAFAVAHPDFVEAKIAKIYLIQGVFGGSYVADYTQGQAHPVDFKMPMGKATQFLALDTLEGVLHWFLGSGVKAVTTHGAKEFVNEIIVEYERIPNDFSDKIFYITSSEKLDKYSGFMQGSGSYLETYYGKNDGLLLPAQQYIEDIGTRLVHYDCDHLDLVMNTKVSNKPYEFRYNFTMKLLDHALKN